MLNIHQTFALIATYAICFILGIFTGYEGAMQRAAREGPQLIYASGCPH